MTGHVPDPEIKRLDQEFCRLYYAKDVEGLRTLLDPGFTYVDGATGAEVPRAEFDRWCLEAAPMRNLIHDQVHTKIEGDTAVLSARNSLERLVDGAWKRFDWRYVNIYRRAGGQWRCTFATVYKV
jgi:ketosteroid isomerase-like protein